MSADTPTPTVAREEGPESRPGLLGRGASLGRYLVVEILGAGGMGVVYSAYDPQLDRKVAVKLLRGGRDDSLGRARLLREAQAMARLQHPNVIAVHDVGTWGDQVFVAMEQVEGPTLGELLRDERPGWEQILALYREAGTGLAAAHAAGLVHRDFKPANVLVGVDGRVRVLDFGLARAIAAGDDEPRETWRPSEGSSGGLLESPLTQGEAVVGTPAYVAPELLLGEPADARSDQYSFAVSLYQGLYGQHPFGDGSFASLVAAVRAGEVRPPPDGSRVPPWVRAAVVRGLARRPEDRFASMTELLAALAADPRARRRRLAATLAVAAAALVAGVGVWSWLAHLSGLCGGAGERLATVWNGERRGAIERVFQASGLAFAGDAWRGFDAAVDAYGRAWVAMRTDACLATRRRGEQSEELLDLRIACLDRRLAELAALTDLYREADAELVERAVETAGALTPLDGCADLEALTAPVRPPEDAQVRTRVARLRERLARADVLDDAGRYADASTVAQSVLAEARQTGYPPLEAEALKSAGGLHLDLGDFAAAERELVDAVIAGETGRHRDVVFEASVLLVNLVGYRLARFPEGHWWARHAEASLEGAVERERSRAYLANQVGNLLQKEGRTAEALAEQRRAARLSEVAAPESLALANALNSLGNALRRAGESQEAAPVLARSLELRERLLGPDHPLVGQSLHNLATAEVSLGDLAAAGPRYERALAIFERSPGPESPLVAITCNNLAELRSLEGKLEEAEGYAARAIAIDTKTLGPGHPDVGIDHHNRAEILLLLGRPRDALAAIELALEIKEKALGSDHPSVATTLSTLAAIALELGQPRRAAAGAERALAIYARDATPADDLGSARWRLANALWALGGRERALALAVQARADFVLAGKVAESEIAAIDAWLADRGR